MKKKNIVRTLIGAALVASIVCGATMRPASAQVTSMRAQLGCRAGQVLVYPPAGGRTTTNSAHTRLETSSELSWWDASAKTWRVLKNSDGSTWTTGWWAYSYTDGYGRPAPPVAYPVSAWAKTSNQTTVAFLPLNVAKGYYWKVRTWIHDYRDNTNAYVWSVLDVDNGTSNNTGDYCQS